MYIAIEVISGISAEFPSHASTAEIGLARMLPFNFLGDLKWANALSFLEESFL